MSTSWKRKLRAFWANVKAWWRKKDSTGPDPVPVPVPDPVPGSGVVLPPAVIGGGRTLTGYGRVNTWAAAGKDVLERDLVACAAAGVSIYTIEMAAWGDASVFKNLTRMASTQLLYEWLVDRCRELGLWLLVSIANDNAGSTKYGGDGMSLAAAMSDIKNLAECVRRCGPANVLVQPVAETQTNAGFEFEAHCKTLLAGFTLVNNAGARPSGPGAMRYFAWHPFAVAEVADAPAGAFIVSDTGRIIVELAGSLDAAGKPDAVKRYVAAVRARGCPAAVYYAFRYAGHDAGTITALGAG